MKLTFAVTTFNRYEMLLESFAGIIDDPRIDEVLIMDDCSEEKYWDKIKDLPKFNQKIKVVRQLQNRGMSVNKRDAVFNSKNEWVILADSDNIFGVDYLEALEVYGKLFPDTIYCPSFAKPNFDYRKYNLSTFGIKNKPPLDESMANCLFNTCNYVVHRDTYLYVWKENRDMKGSDTIWFNYLWLQADKVFHVVENMHYQHRVHKESGFIKDLDYNMKKAEEIKKMIMDL